jgi:CubicO group peptidase (beta-lactamase class C family)
MPVHRLLFIAAISITGFVATTSQAQRTSTEPTRAELTPLPTGLTDAIVSAHILSPTQLATVETDADDSREAILRLAEAVKTFTATPHLEVAEFGAALYNALKDKVAGYVFQIRQNGNLIHTGIWQWAQTPSDQGKGWTVDTRMHVASVSKFLTGVGMVKLLDAKGISYDTPIIGYLPTYWTKGPNIDQITFRHLFTHRSGFNTGSSRSDYPTMMSRVADGVASVGAGHDEIMNFGLMRILIPIINGDVSKAAKFHPDAVLNDQIWDAVTLYQFKNYMQANVFTPAGVANVSFKPIAGMANALAYKPPPSNLDGWDSGDLGASAGGAAFRLSVKELLSVMDHVRRRNTIIPAPRAQYMLDNNFGINGSFTTPAGRIYFRKGRWASSCVTGTDNCKTEQSLAEFWPN